MVIEAMKMETVIHAKTKGTVKKLYVQANDEVQSGDLLVEVE